MGQGLVCSRAARRLWFGRRRRPTAGDAADAARRCARRCRRVRGGSGHAFGASCKQPRPIATTGCSAMPRSTPSYAADESAARTATRSRRARFRAASCTPLPAAPYDTPARATRATRPCRRRRRDAATTARAWRSWSMTRARRCTRAGRAAIPAAKNACGRTGYTCDFDLEGVHRGLSVRRRVPPAAARRERRRPAGHAAPTTISRARCATPDLPLRAPRQRQRQDRRRRASASTTATRTACACRRTRRSAMRGSPLATARSSAATSTAANAKATARCARRCARCRPARHDRRRASRACEVGAEPEADQIGAARPRQGLPRRLSLPVQRRAARSGQGVCVGGNYNAVAKNNVGASCKTDAECYSPFGLGHCLRLRVDGVAAPSGTCTVMDCAVPESARRHLRPEQPVRRPRRRRHVLRAVLQAMRSECAAGFALHG